MASAFSHVVVATVLGQAAFWKKMPTRFWALSMFCTVLPDIDVVGFSFGVEYGDPWGHRGMTHSLFFALVVSPVIVQIAFSDATPFSGLWWRLIVHFFIVTASHGVLDAMTSGGLGVAFFAPFDPTRYFLPWRPVKVSPIGVIEFFSPWGLEVLVSELVWIWIPALAVLVGVKAWRWGK